MGLRIVEATKGAGVKFTSKTLDELNSEYKELQKFYDKAQLELVKTVTETCGKLFTVSCFATFFP